MIELYPHQEQSLIQRLDLKVKTDQAKKKNIKTLYRFQMIQRYHSRRIK